MSDPAVQLVGYQPNFDVVELGLILFNHQSCKTTLGLEAGLFRSLYEGPIYRAQRHKDAICPGMCFHYEDVKRCQIECECSWVQEILQQIRNWGKRAGASVLSSWVERG